MRVCREIEKMIWGRGFTQKLSLSNSLSVAFTEFYHVHDHSAAWPEHGANSLRPEQGYYLCFHRLCKLRPHPGLGRSSTKPLLPGTPSDHVHAHAFGHMFLCGQIVFWCLLSHVVARRSRPGNEGSRRVRRPECLANIVMVFCSRNGKFFAMLWQKLPSWQKNMRPGLLG
jgi:hypothetical protein